MDRLDARFHVRQNVPRSYAPSGRFAMMHRNSYRLPQSIAATDSSLGFCSSVWFFCWLDLALARMIPRSSSPCPALLRALGICSIAIAASFQRAPGWLIRCRTGSACSRTRMDGWRRNRGFLCRRLGRGPRIRPRFRVALLLPPAPPLPLLMLARAIAFLMAGLILSFLVVSCLHGWFLRGILPGMPPPTTAILLLDGISDCWNALYLFVGRQNLYHLAFDFLNRPDGKRVGWSPAVLLLGLRNPFFTGSDLLL